MKNATLLIHIYILKLKSILYTHTQDSLRYHFRMVCSRFIVANQLIKHFPRFGVHKKKRTEVSFSVAVTNKSCQWILILNAMVCIPPKMGMKHHYYQNICKLGKRREVSSSRRRRRRKEEKNNGGFIGKPLQMIPTLIVANKYSCLIAFKLERFWPEINPTSFSMNFRIIND